MELNEQAFIPLNGALQYISVRAEKKGAPLLLYLHGGPGDAALPLVLKFNRELESILPWWYGSSGGRENPITGSAPNSPRWIPFCRTFMRL